ncbi:hypothetical protein [Pseudoneobacillus sp. C159]
MIKWLIGKSGYLLFVYILGLLIVILSPFWLWTLKESRPLDVLIVDKTVPDETYREHKGLVWLLNNEKVVKSNKESYSLNKDYIGFFPKKNEKFEIKSFPENLEDYQVIYLADQYGVYQEEFYGKNPLGKRSESIYGGLQQSEVEQLEDTLFKSPGKTLIAEFNTFGSPTTIEARTKISNLLNVNWTGWIGRYFPNLATNEVPVWVKESYEGKWDFHGGGIIFVNENDYVYVIQEKDLTQKGIPIKFTERGNDYFRQELDSNYQYWFDILEPRNDDEVLATFHLPVKKNIGEQLAEIGIPLTFPAINLHQNAQYTSYYFSGDFADEEEVPGIYQTRGLSLWKQYVSGRDSFYWKTYVPMMRYILKYGLHKEVERENVELFQQNGITYNSQTGDQFIQILKDGKWENIIIKGVNMGIAKPGYFPGEAAITKDEYLRWFRAIGDMNANTFRVYTLHPPAFYEALYEYNQTAKKPLYLFHGAWVTEEKLIHHQNAFAKEVIDDFQLELRQMIDIIHGNITIPERPGHSWGEYKTDVSRYVLGFIIGTEWDPNVVLETNNKNKKVGQWNGRYFVTESASPFEIWLAQMMDYTASYEAEHYGWQHTMSFTNWVTTDLLKHPAEPSVDEDLVSVNPNHIHSTEAFKAGLFASYHIYPYYPDFLNYEPNYLNYKDQDGKPNNYAGYLHELISEHDMPVLVAEFGVPSSRGLTHLNAYGMDQGHHSEQEQGEINTRLYKSILHEGYAGGLVFTWQDEWFKRTWNTMDLDNPERRPYWNNVQTNEQHFGLLSFEPSAIEKQIYVDGKEGDWKKVKAVPIYQSSTKNSAINGIDLFSDSGYLYTKLRFNQPIDWQKDDIYLLLNTISDQGQNKVTLSNGETVETKGVDFMVQIKDEHSANIMVDSYYDPFYFQYGELLKMIRVAPYANKKANGIFHPIRLALNKEMVIPSTKKKYPFTAYETGQLMFGDGNPNHNEYNSLTDISLSKDGKLLELRIAWQLLNVKDPSMKEALGDLWSMGLEGSQKIDTIQMNALLLNNGKILNTDWVNQSIHYNWNEWEQPIFAERLKKSYYIMKKTFESVDAWEGKK